jgi:hypothetical protein
LEVAFQFLALPEEAASLAFAEGAGKFGDLDPGVELGATAERQIPVFRGRWVRRVGGGERARQVQAFALQVFALSTVVGRPRLAEKLRREQDGFLPGDEQ